jgi:methionyl-tRNA synthetase
MYCAACKRFLADRFVFGECPQPGCGSSDARGDQCDKCTKPTSPEKLVNPRCFLCRTRPEQRVSAHLYLDLPKLTPPLSKWFAESEQKGKWSANAVATTNAWLHEGLEERFVISDTKLFFSAVFPVAAFPVAAFPVAAFRRVVSKLATRTGVFRATFHGARKFLGTDIQQR